MTDHLRAVSIASTAGVAMPNTVEVRDLDTGAPLWGVRRVTTHIVIGEPIVAEIEIVFANLATKEAKPVLGIVHPLAGGEFRAVKEIRWADGAVFSVDAPDDARAAIFEKVLSALHEHNGAHDAPFTGEGVRSAAIAVCNALGYREPEVR